MMDVQIPGREIHSVAFSFVSQNYFTTLGIPIVVGRALQQGDPSWGRGREMGIRIALGAKGRDIYRAVLGSSMQPVVVG
jgi:hypothetical protein